MRNIVRFMLVCCLMLTANITAFADASSSAKNNGIITAVNIQDKTIQIGKNVYGIADGVQIFTKDKELLSQLALQPGQEIQYTLESQPLKLANLPTQVMTYIRILNGYERKLKS